MHNIQHPDIVISAAGHDKGRPYIVLKRDGAFLLLVDGKTRKLTKPKVKSLKHVEKAKMGTPELAGAFNSGTATDSLIRKELAKLRSEAGMTEEGSQLVKRRFN